jgi:hypothetical protein
MNSIDTCLFDQLLRGRIQPAMRILDAGLCDFEPLFVAGLETIDASAVSTGSLVHGPVSTTKRLIGNFQMNSIDTCVSISSCV